MFNEWLLKQLEERGWKQADLARYSGITTGSISNYINGRIPDKNVLKKIAKAFKIPPEIVFRAANLLPEENPKTELIEQITHLIQELPQSEQQEIFEFIKFRFNLAEKRGNNENKRTPKNPTVIK